MKKGSVQWTDDVFIIAKKIMLILMLNYQIEKKHILLRNIKIYF